MCRFLKDFSERSAEEFDPEEADEGFEVDIEDIIDSEE